MPVLKRRREKERESERESTRKARPASLEKEEID
jgi:hypothetical protein